MSKVMLLFHQMPDNPPKSAAVGAFRSAVAVQVAGRRWLGLLL